jgi:hypothetical protein
MKEGKQGGAVKRGCWVNTLYLGILGIPGKQRTYLVSLLFKFT